MTCMICYNLSRVDMDNVDKTTSCTPAASSERDGLQTHAVSTIFF